MRQRVLPAVATFQKAETRKGEAAVSPFPVPEGEA